MSAPSVRASMGLGAPCPKCGCTGSAVVDTRKVVDGTYRRRRCSGCGERYITVEVVFDGDVGFTHDYSKGRARRADPKPMTREQKVALLRSRWLARKAAP